MTAAIAISSSGESVRFAANVKALSPLAASYPVGMINAADRDWVVALGACRTLQAAGGTVEDVLLFLRRAGFWKMDSIRALRELEGMTLGEAKIAVHAGLLGQIGMKWTKLSMIRWKPHWTLLGRKPSPTKGKRNEWAGAVCPLRLTTDGHRRGVDRADLGK